MSVWPFSLPVPRKAQMTHGKRETTTGDVGGRCGESNGRIFNLTTHRQTLPETGRREGRDKRAGEGAGGETRPAGETKFVPVLPEPMATRDCGREDFVRRAPDGFEVSFDPYILPNHDVCSLPSRSQYVTAIPCHPCLYVSAFLDFLDKTTSCTFRLCLPCHDSSSYLFDHHAALGYTGRQVGDGHLR